MAKLLDGLRLAKPKPKAPLVREFFRYEVTIYMQSGKICQTVRFTPLKRISIREEDQGLQGHIDHYGEADTIDPEHGVLHLPSDPENGRIYEAKYADAGRDYESGHVEDYWWELVPVPLDDPLIQVKGD